MKAKFDFTLRGKDWFLPFICYWVLYLVVYVPVVLSAPRPSEGLPSYSAAYVGFSLLFFAFLIVAVPIFTILVLRIFASKLTVNGKTFSFEGKIGDFLKMFIGGSLLSIITLGIYFAWFERKVLAYLADETILEEKNFEFHGTGGKLFGYILLSLVLPMVVFAVLFAVMAVALGTSSTAATLAMCFMGLLALVVFSPFFYLILKWCVDYYWNGLEFKLSADFWPSCGMILSQLALSLISVFIYSPAAGLRLYRYFVERVSISKEGQTVGNLSFQGGIGKGFCLIWGQLLLSIITLGIYIPWAMAKIYGWVAAETEVEITEA
jgi:uncharacterized membrane protein YjgN (DUF898 family)